MSRGNWFILPPWAGRHAHRADEDKFNLLRRWNSLSLSARILVGLGLGIFAGLFFGEPAAVLQPVADIYIRLMQMTVLPYLITSLVVAFGLAIFAAGRSMRLVAPGYPREVAVAPRQFPRIHRSLRRQRRRQAGLWPSATWVSRWSSCRADRFGWVRTNPAMRMLGTKSCHAARCG